MEGSAILIVLPLTVAVLVVAISAMNLRTYEGEVNSDIGSRRILDLVVRLHLKMTAKDRGTSEESCLFRILPNQVFYDICFLPCSLMQYLPFHFDVEF